MGGSINGGFHQWMIYNGTSEKGVPPFRKPPYLGEDEHPGQPFQPQYGSLNQKKGLTMGPHIFVPNYIYIGSSTSQTTCESLVLSGWHPRLQGAHRCLSQQVNLVTEGVIHHAQGPPQRVIQYHHNAHRDRPLQDATGDPQFDFDLQLCRSKEASDLATSFPVSKRKGATP